MLGFMGKMLQHWGCTPKLNCSMVLLLQKTNLSPCSAGACCNVGQWLGALWLSWQMSWLMQSQQADVCISLTVLTSPCRWENEGCFCKGSGIYWSRVHLAPVGAAWCVGVPFCEMSNQRKKEDPLTCLAVFLFIYQNWRSHFFPFSEHGKPLLCRALARLLWLLLQNTPCCVSCWLLNKFWAHLSYWQCPMAL